MPLVSLPARPGIATHYKRYLGSNFLVVAAGFVSFPAMARLLDNREFGLLGYYEAWLLMVAGVLKLGAQHAILRFYPHAGTTADLTRFRSEQILVPFALSLLLWLCCVGIALALSQQLPATERPIVVVLLLTIPLLIWCSLVESVMYALERSDISLWLKTSWRWSELALVLITIGFLNRAALGVLAAKLAVLVIVALWLTIWFRRWLRAPLVAPEQRQVLAGLAFGLPMMLNELSTVMFGLADRIMLRWLTGSLHEVGVYTIGYGLAMAVGMVFGATLNQTFTPTALREYAAHGNEAVRELKRRMLDIWIVVVMIVVALLLCTGREFLELLAGGDKARSGPVFVIVAVTLVWYSLLDIAQYGLLLQRRATRFLLITLSATALNLALNVPLILHFGVLGAAWATAASYAFLGWMQYRQCPRELRYLPPPRRVAMALLFPPLVYSLLLACDYFGARGPTLRLLVGALAVTLPGALLLWSDASVREGVRRMLQQRRDRAGTA